jgi:AcrR family transcriptional regulator
MTPRPYRMARRREATEENRQRIIGAARELLASRQGTARFSMGAVARRAGVARMTVYYQFGSFQGLLQGLCDSLAVAGGMGRLREAFGQPDPLEALDHFVAAFIRFWESDRTVLRGLGAFAVFNLEVAAVLEERAEWRRKGLRVLLERIAKQTGRPKPKELEDKIDLLFTLTAFSTYDTLATPKRSLAQVTGMVQRLVREGLA